VKIRAATTKILHRRTRGWITAAAFLPLLTACSTSDFSGLWFGSSPSSQEQSVPDGPETTQADKTNFNRAACGLFFGHSIGLGDTVSAKAGSNPSSEISLERSPEDNFLQAISYDMRGDYENARKLYVWLTASPPDKKVDLDCGQGVRLSGSINSLAQRRLVALDESSPEYARSKEIDAVVASATIAPGPELPNPPMIERDRRFYETGGVVEAEPEAPTGPVVRMDMEVSENTAQLTRVERRSAAPNPTPATTPAPRSTSGMATNQTETTVSKLAPVVAPVSIQSVPSPTPAPVIDAPTIAGDEASTDHTGAIVTSNARPSEQGELDIVDRQSTPPMIELSMTSTEPTPTPTQNAMAPAAETPATQETTARQTAQANAPYYAVQLAAYRSRGRAENAWPKFQNASHGMLSAADHEVVSIAIEGKGLFFRLLTGMYSSSAEASQACNTLKSAGTDCLVRRVNP
jgi:hypothetical protein